MNDTYSTYLQSEAWENKRQHLFTLRGRRCEACGITNEIHVHHLTYERIFKEDIGDLMVLCKLHHEAAEEFCRKGIIEKSGNPAELRVKTLKFVAPWNKKLNGKRRKPTRPPKKPVRHEDFIGKEKLRELLSISDRQDFKRQLYVLCENFEKKVRSRTISKAFQKWNAAHAPVLVRVSPSGIVYLGR